MPKPQTSKNLTLGDETTKFMWAPMGKLVPQISGVLNFAYDLHFRHVIAHWKFIFKNYALHYQTLTLSMVWMWRAKITLFRAPKLPWKYNKMCWHEYIKNKPVELGGRPPVSTWKMCMDLDNPERVEPTITKKYRRMLWTKNSKKEPVGIGGWPPISTWITYHHHRIVINICQRYSI